MTRMYLIHQSSPLKNRLSLSSSRHDASEGDISYIPETGAHAGPSPDELYTFVVCGPSVTLPVPIEHPVELYPHFLDYRAA